MIFQMQIKRYFLYLLAFIYCFFLTLSSGCSTKPYQRKMRLIMGTVIEIVAQDEQAIDKAFSEIERIDNLMSTYNPDSEISRLNRKKKLKVSDEVLELIKKAKYFYEISDGAFDITVGPLVKLWNIKENMQREQGDIRIPKEQEIKKALSYVGSKFIEIDEQNKIIKLKKKKVVLDLGAIAKGYAVDKAVEVLKKEGVKSALINAGGDIYCLGKKGRNYWVIGLKNPREMNSISEAFKLKDRAVATSGDYEQFFIYKNKRFSHIIDPRTGYPVDNSISSVTVFANDCLTADALATAIFVLGEEEGRKMAKNFKDIEIKIIKKR
jgi:thiamine biosynthesis lipoprotein